MTKIPGLLLAILGTALPSQAFAQAANPPKVLLYPKDYVPQGWKLLKQAEGDLNKDGLSDVVLVVGSPKEDTEEGMDEPRPLRILFQKPDGTFSLSTWSEKLILCKMCGGVFGDPLADVTIERGTLVIQHYGGSNHRWGYTHRFRFQEGGWHLIGRTTMSRHNLTGENHEKDENLLTGDVVETSTDDKGKTVTKKSKTPKAPLKKLSEVNVGE